MSYSYIRSIKGIENMPVPLKLIYRFKTIPFKISQKLFLFLS